MTASNNIRICRCTLTAEVLGGWAAQVRRADSNHGAGDEQVAAG
jgi:hypothetical protein